MSDSTDMGHTDARTAGLRLDLAEARDRIDVIIRERDVARADCEHMQTDARKRIELALVELHKAQRSPSTRLAATCVCAAIAALEGKP